MRLSECNVIYLAFSVCFLPCHSYSAQPGRVAFTQPEGHPYDITTGGVFLSPLPSKPP